MARGLDPFLNIFSDIYDYPFWEAVLDQVDRALGVYELLCQGSTLTLPFPKEAIDLEGALERALRPAFRRSQPSNEQQVQDVLETILNTLGIGSTRERETVTVGARIFRPDFVLADLDLALEVKLSRDGHGASEVQEEIAADIAAYKTRWRRVLIVVYDIGQIGDPVAFRRENAKHFGVTVVVVKH